MIFNIANYEIQPHIVKSGEIQDVTVLSLNPYTKFNDSTEYTIKIIPMEICTTNHSYSHSGIADFDTIEIFPINGNLSFSYTFYDEQEWIICVFPTNEPENVKKFKMYSLFPDLYERTPYKGDLHVHSCCSDGNEEPAVVAANYRKAGFDFMAITDHRKWIPSKEVIEKYQDAPIDLKLFYGEEVHIPGMYIHIVNFGGAISVNDLYFNNVEKYDDEIKKYSESIKTPYGVNALEFSYRKWISDNIKRGGGLSIVTHPHWIFQDEYNMGSKMLDYIFKQNIFDAFELIGGQSVPENNLQVAFYNDMRAKGIHIPIVGSSDSHGTEPPVCFNLAKTIVFSKDLELDSIKDAIKNSYSVAIDSATNEHYRIHGTYRMVKFALFMMQNYFPKHDDLCVEEGIMMKEYILNNATAKLSLKNLKGRVSLFTKSFYGKQ